MPSHSPEVRTNFPPCASCGGTFVHFSGCLTPETAHISYLENANTQTIARVQAATPYDRDELTDAMLVSLLDSQTINQGYIRRIIATLRAERERTWIQREEAARENRAWRRGRDRYLAILLRAGTRLGLTDAETSARPSVILEKIATLRAHADELQRQLNDPLEPGTGDDGEL